MPKSPEYVVPWTEILAYFQGCRERTILEMSEGADLQAIYRAQGKLTLLNELLNLQDIRATLSSLGKE